MKPEITFTPFDDSESDEGFEQDSDSPAYIHATLDIRFDGGEEDGPIKLAEMLLAAFRTGENCLIIPGRLWVFHDDECRPPSVFIDSDVLPKWLREIIDRYGSTESSKEMRRLQRIVDAVTSPEPDSHFTEEENEHRRSAVSAQNTAFGSREDLRGRLKAAVAALNYYAASDNSDVARQTLEFIREKGA